MILRRRRVGDNIVRLVAVGQSVCRVTVDGATRFTCVDGPDFDAHKVDWDELMARQRTYLEEEKLSLEKWRRDVAGG